MDATDNPSQSCSDSDLEPTNHSVYFEQEAISSCRFLSHLTRCTWSVYSTSRVSKWDKYASHDPSPTFVPSRIFWTYVIIWFSAPASTKTPSTNRGTEEKLCWVHCLPSSKLTLCVSECIPIINPATLMACTQTLSSKAQPQEQI